MEHKCDKVKDIERLLEVNDKQDKDIDERVKWTMFWAIMLVLFSISGAVVSNLYSQMDETHQNVDSNTQKIESKLNETSIAQAKIDVQYIEIQKTLAEIKLQLSKIK